MKTRHEHDTIDAARDCGCLKGRPYPIVEAIVPEHGDLQCPWCGGPVDVAAGYAGTLSSLGCAQSTGCRRAVGYPHEWEEDIA